MMRNNQIKYWDKIAHLYNKMFDNTETYQQMYNFIRKALNKNMRVLEIGTGTGMIARNIAKNVKKVEAIDFSEKMIHQAQEIKHAENINFTVGDILDLSYDNASFDVVITANILHIIPNPEKALEEVHRVLKKNGLLISPTFLWKENSLKGKILKKLMKMSGFPIYKEWDTQLYTKFIEENRFKIQTIKKIKSSFTLCCVTCIKEE